MGFADWFDLLPKVNNFRPLLFCGPTLTIDEGIKAAAWRLSILTFIRILLLSSWGMATIQWENPITASKLTGIWLEFLILIGLISISIVMILVTWRFPTKCLYPCIVGIPIIFIFDFSIKATCYEVVFLTPVSGFGILSLIEFWIRYGALIQTWLLLTTVIRCPDPLKSDEHIYRPSSSIYHPQSTSSIIKRNNSSLWEKPSQLPKRNASIPPNLPQISERSCESYYTDSTNYTNPNSSRRSRKGRRPASYHQNNSNSNSIVQDVNSNPRHSVHSHHTHQSVSHSTPTGSIPTNRSNYNYESQRDSYGSHLNSQHHDSHQYSDEKYSDEEPEMELPPPPPRTKPQWNAPEWKVREPAPAPEFDDKRASRQTSNNSSINAFRQNWQGATNWKSLTQPVNRMNSDMSEMTQYSQNGSPRNRHESPLI